MHLQPAVCVMCLTEIFKLNLSGPKFRAHVRRHFVPAEASGSIEFDKSVNETSEKSREGLCSETANYSVSRVCEIAIIDIYIFSRTYR